MGEEIMLFLTPLVRHSFLVVVVLIGSVIRF